ncbi:glycosyltransferase family 9 protein [Candidatus Woesearchaeota archaeon]|nr:glycosyltransferase family 9 protein [Candidatus Woesearchaeota archaeon]
MTSLTILFQRIIDKCIFSPLCYVLSPLKINKILFRSDVKKILIIKFWALGDSVVLLPLLSALKKEFPKAKIDVLAHERNRIIFEGQKNINKIINFGTLNIIKNFRKYDLCIDAEPALSVSAVVAFIMSKFRLGFSHGARKRTYQKTIEFRKTQHMVQNYLDFARKLGIKYDTEELEPISVSENEKKSVDLFLKKNKIKSRDLLVGIVPGLAESVKYRMWPAEKFAKLADELAQKRKAKILFIDSNGNKKIIEKIRSLMISESLSSVDEFGSPKNLKKSAELAGRCDVVISNDSGMMHIAAAQGAKTIGLFGPNTPNLWAPYGKNNAVVFKPKTGCPYMENKSRDLLPKKLTKEQLTCMDAISVNDVMHIAEKLIRK